MASASSFLAWAISLKLFISTSWDKTLQFYQIFVQILIYQIYAFSRRNVSCSKIEVLILIKNIYYDNDYIGKLILIK